jgi:hypothetical protein
MSAEKDSQGGTTMMMVGPMTIGGILNTANLPCPVGMTTNKSSFFFNINDALPSS